MTLKVFVFFFLLFFSPPLLSGSTHSRTHILKWGHIFVWSKAMGWWIMKRRKKETIMDKEIISLHAQLMISEIKNCAHVMKISASCVVHIFVCAGIFWHKCVFGFIHFKLQTKQLLDRNITAFLFDWERGASSRGFVPRSFRFLQQRLFLRAERWVLIRRISQWPFFSHAE